MRHLPPRKPTGTSGRQVGSVKPSGAARAAAMDDAHLRERLQRNAAFRVTTIDGLNWIDPYTGTVVPAPFGLDEPALAWLRQHHPWQRGGKPVEPKTVEELETVRWVHYLRTSLPEPEHAWLRQFLPDGRWLNPFDGQPVSGITRDNGRITMDTVRQLAAVLRACPPARRGKPLSREQLTVRLRELLLPPARAKPSTDPPAAPAPAVASPAADGEPGTARATRARHPSSTSALEPSTRATRRTAKGDSRAGRAESRSGKPDSRAQARRSNQPQTEPSVRVVSGYRILGTLGMGGMSTVYRAVQLSLEREVALKVLDQQGPPDPSYTERFLREARAAGRINHPNVVTCFDVGVHHGNRLYMALELVTGGDATQLADRHGGRLPERLALALLRDAARGLGAIHAVGMIHRDIKPANLFIAADGSTKLGDLGLVRHAAGNEADKYKTLVGIAVGTPAFMSPEQSQGAQDLDIRTDVYSLGASVFALLAGRPPFEAETVFDLVKCILNQAAPDIRALRPDISPVTAAVLAKAMAKERGARQQTPAELQQAAEHALMRLTGGDRTPSEPEPVQRATMLPPGSDKLRANGCQVAEVRGKGLIATLGLGGSVLCVAASAGVLPVEQAKEFLDRRLRQYLAALRGPLPGQPEATPASLCRALLVDGLSAAIAQVELGQKTLTIACTPGAKAAVADPREAQVLCEVSDTPQPLAFARGALLALSAGHANRPLVLWGSLVGRCDQGVDIVAGHMPLTAEGDTILLLGHHG